jgi:hypothetical protein
MHGTSVHYQQCFFLSFFLFLYSAWVTFLQEGVVFGFCMGSYFTIILLFHPKKICYALCSIFPSCPMVPKLWSRLLRRQISAGFDWGPNKESSVCRPWIKDQQKLVSLFISSTIPRITIDNWSWIEGIKLFFHVWSKYQIELPSYRLLILFYNLILIVLNTPPPSNQYRVRIKTFLHLSESYISQLSKF